MARLTAPDGRSRLPVLIIAGVVVLALVAGGAYLLGRSGNHDSATPATPHASATASISYGASYDPPPSGCLGGQQRNAAMVLAAQRQAGHSAYGAVEVAAALFRWGYRYPYPDTSEIKSIRPVLDPSTASKQETEFAQDYASAGYRQPGDESVSPGTPYYITMANGGWLVDEGSSSDNVTVEVGAHYVVGTAYSNTEAQLRFVMHRAGGHWQLVRLEQAGTSASANGATEFTSGC